VAGEHPPVPGLQHDQDVVVLDIGVLEVLEGRQLRVVGAENIR
jgi:hypothetical protein